MSGYYASNPHYAPEDYRDQEELQERREAEASRWFFELVKPQLARRNERLAAASAYKGAPRWDRERAAAEREFAETTKEAAAIHEMVLRDLQAAGEVSEATSYAADRVEAGCYGLADGLPPHNEHEWTRHCALEGRALAAQAAE